MRIEARTRIRRLFPLHMPEQTQIGIKMLPAGPEHNAMVAVRLDEPAVMDADILLDVEVATDNIHSPFLPLSVPDTVNIRTFGTILPIPDILDVFTDVVYPGNAGKAYAEPDKVEITHKRKKRNRRHSLFESEARSRKRATIDVFDRLLPYLQPPVEVSLSNLTLFPENLRPYHYQAEGIFFLSKHGSALLGDDMGLGKTMQSIIALSLLFQKAKVRRSLILCRRSLLSVWESELKKWAPELFYIKVRGTPSEREYLWSSPAPVYLTTYETLRNDIERFPHIADKFDVVISDEVQEIKNASTKKSRAVRKVNGAYKWGLSGTPLENRLEEVVSIFAYLKPGLFPASILSNSSSNLSPHFVKTRIKPYFLRRKLEEVLTELPEKVTNTIWLELTPEQWKSYEREYQTAKTIISGPHVTRALIFTRITKLKEICNIDPVTGKSAKLEYLIDQLEDIIGAEQKALVFSQFPNVTLRRITSQLDRFHPAVFDGSLNDTERKELIQSFQNQSVPKVMLMSVKSGGVGLTLTRANHVFHFDHWWNPATAKQAEGRVYRIGQDRTVFVYDLFTHNTIEERIHKLLDSKMALFDEVIDDLSVKGVQRAISDKELFELFDLEPPPGFKR